MVHLITRFLSDSRIISFHLKEKHRRSIQNPECKLHLSLLTTVEEQKRDEPNEASNNEVLGAEAPVFGSYWANVTRQGVQAW